MNEIVNPGCRDENLQQNDISKFHVEKNVERPNDHTLSLPI